MNTELIDVTPLQKTNIVQIIRNAKTLDEAVSLMNGIAANGHLTLWNNATHPDGTSYWNLVKGQPMTRLIEGSE